MKAKSNRICLIGYYFIAPSVIGVTLFYFLPFLSVIKQSFFNVVNTHFVGFDNYLLVLSNEAFILSVKNTLKFMGICIPILVVLSLVLACYINYRIEHKTFVKAIMLFPLAIPVSTISLFCKLLFSSSGFLNTFLQSQHMSVTNWIESRYALWIMILLYIWKNTGYSVILWCVALDTVPKEIYEAAKMDGANYFQKLIKITLPNLVTSLSVIIFLSIFNSFKVYRESYMIAGNYPNPSAYMTQNVFNNWFQDFSVDKMSAGAVIMAIILSIIVMCFNKIWFSKAGVNETNKKIK